MGGVAVVPFEVVFINEGNVWNTNSNGAGIPVKGVYYIHLDICTCPDPAYNLIMNVNINNQSYFAAQFLPLSTGGSMTRGQAAIASLEIGDFVSVSCPIGPRQCYNPPAIGFYGFLLSLQ